MVFSLPTDRAYPHAKQIVRGEATIDPDLAVFAVEFESTFGVPRLTSR